TAYDEDTGVLNVEAQGFAPLAAHLGSEAGRQAFAAWLTEFMGEAAFGPLKVLAAPEGHRFTDSPRGFVSILNLASLRDLEAQTGRPVAPLRFRANIQVEGWPAWIENDLAGRELRLGAGRARAIKPITRCLATHANPATGERDLDVLAALFNGYGHALC